MKAWNAFKRVAGPGRAQVVLQPYLFYDNRTVMFEATKSQEERYAPRLQRTCYAGGDQVVLPVENGDGQ